MCSRFRSDARARCILKREPRFLEMEDAIWQLIEEEAKGVDALLAPD